MTMRSGPVSEVTVLVAGAASGTALVLEEPLSFWGGIEPETGRIIDRRHPQLGLEVTGRILVMPIGRGSSSSSTVFAEAIRRGTAPAAVFLHEIDPIVALGAVVAQRLYAPPSRWWWWTRLWRRASAPVARSISTIPEE